MALSKNDMQSKQCQAYYYIEWCKELMNVPLVTFIQTASIHLDPLQLSPAVLDKRLGVLSFLAVDRTNLAYKE